MRKPDTAASKWRRGEAASRARALQGSASTFGRAPAASAPAAEHAPTTSRAPLARSRRPRTASTAPEMRQPPEDPRASSKPLSSRSASPSSNVAAACSPAGGGGSPLGHWTPSAVWRSLSARGRSRGARRSTPTATTSASGSAAAASSEDCPKDGRILGRPPPAGVCDGGEGGTGVASADSSPGPMLSQPSRLNFTAADAGTAPHARSAEAAASGPSTASRATMGPRLIARAPA
mmetsp:Transcript_45342/g.145393  ORF Transcript_45342/g.145393 Transcript_45342/m.145393 type:complete len:234 (+) Transcript_45342:1096-1797(+)